MRNKIRTLAGEGRDGGLASAIKFCGKVSGGQHADADGTFARPGRAEAQPSRRWVRCVRTSRAGGRAGAARAETGRDVAGREGDYRPFRARSSATRSGAATTRSPTMPACSSKWQ